MRVTISYLYIASRSGNNIVLSGECIYIKEQSKALTMITRLSLCLNQILPPEYIHSHGLDDKKDMIWEYKLRYTSLSLKVAIQMHTCLPGTHLDQVGAPHYKKRKRTSSVEEDKNESAKKKYKGKKDEGKKQKKKKQKMLNRGEPGAGGSAE